MQTIQEPDVLQQPFCESGDKNIIPSTATGSQLASLAEGFPAITQQPVTQGGIPPERMDFNGAFNLLSKYNYAIQNGWLPTFKQEVSTAIGGYAEGACLWYMPTEGTYAGQVLMLRSLVANNTYDFTANPDSYIGTYWKIVTSAGGGAAFPLLSFIYSDHLLNDASWLRADTFSWQSGNVYVSAYQHLVDDINGITAETETVAGTAITFYRATDGHKVVLADQESNVATIFNATGIAWYYILDTTNQRFKLPRSKWNFVGLRDSVGGYVAESLPNVKTSGTVLQSWGNNAGSFTDGPIYKPQSTGFGLLSNGSYNNTGPAYFNLNTANGTYQDNAPVQERATQAYLYFYVGNTVQDQTTIDVGEITEEINEINSRPYIVEKYQNGTEWYRVWSDGWCEQGGLIARPSVNTTITVTLLKPYKDTNWEYVDSMQLYSATGLAWDVEHESSSITAKTANSFTRIIGNGASYSWQACGYIS